MDWRLQNILVTGGASFIGSHLVDELLKIGVNSIRVVDNLSSGKLENIQKHIDNNSVEFVKGDLLYRDTVKIVLRNVDIVFHLAAAHGGRGYVDMHQADCAKNFSIDNAVIQLSHESGVKKLIYASSGCVYPNYLQNNTFEELFLTEDMVGPPYDPDNLYGWAKLAGEITLQSFFKEYGFKSVSCRIFTAYGERGLENHAIIAMIARAFLKQNPFEVWGDGQQIRNWTYVSDIVQGMISSAENTQGCIVINLGTQERICVINAVKEILDYTGHKAEILFLPNKPTGPLNRVANNCLAKKLLNWEPKVGFIDGLHRTIDWYFTTKNFKQIEMYLDKMLCDRFTVM